MREKLPTLRHVDTFITIWRAGSEGENCAIPTKSAGQKRARDTMLEARAAAVGQQMRAELGEQFTTQVISQLVKLIQAAPRGTMPPLEPPEPPVEQVLLYPPETECCDESLLAEPAQQHKSQGEGADDKDAPFFVIHRFGKPPAEGREFKKVCQRCKTVYRYSEVITPPAKKQGATAPRRRRYRAGTRNLKYWRSPANSTVAYESALLDSVWRWNERAKVSTMGYVDVHNDAAGPNEPLMTKQHLNDALFDRETISVLQEEGEPVPDVQDMQVRSKKKTHTRRAGTALRKRIRIKWAKEHRRRCWNPRGCIGFSIDGVNKLNGPAICKRRYRHNKRVPGWPAAPGLHRIAGFAARRLLLLRLGAERRAHAAGGRRQGRQGGGGGWNPCLSDPSLGGTRRATRRDRGSSWDQHQQRHRHDRRGPRPAHLLGLWRSCSRILCLCPEWPEWRWDRPSTGTWPRL